MKLHNLLGILAVLALSTQAHSALIINETMADPNGPGTADIDSNCDGMFDSSEDEFVELVNDDTLPLDISGWTLEDAAALRHTFAPGTVLAPGQAFVLFGGGSSTSACTCGALFDVASAGFLGLNNGGDTVTIFDDMGVMQASAMSGSGDGVSSTRDPDLTGSFVLHDSLAGGLASSVGKMNDGVTPFAVPEPSPFFLLGMALLGFLGIGKRR